MGDEMGVSGLGRGRLAVLVATLVCAGVTWARSPPAAFGADGRVTVAGIREHLAALQAVADRNGGNRLAGTAGYDASARYVASRLRAAGYRVRLQEFEVSLVLDRSPPTLRVAGAAATRYRERRDFVTAGYSGSGNVERRVFAVDLQVPSPKPNTSTSGCEAADFDGFPRGAVALVQRGTCRFRVKAENAVAAGAGALVVFNEGGKGRRGLFGATFGAPQVDLPALSTTFALGDALRNGRRSGPTGVVVRLKTDTIAERRTTRNVIAESPAGDPGNIVVAGAHLDSVVSGPGINDNGTGSAVLLEVAEQLATSRPRNRLRFIWWSAEELGLIGSRYYVARLSADERRQVALYLNVDMAGSPNFVRFVYDGDGSRSKDRRTQAPAGSAPIERLFARYFDARNLPYRETGIGAGSDHLSFIRAGIPVGGLFSGAEGRKSKAQAAVFGGSAGRAYDACYHEACDRLANVNWTVLGQLANAMAHAVATFAQDTSRVKRR